MTLADSQELQVAESLSGAETLFDRCEQEMMDLATLCRLTDPESTSRALATLDRVAVEHDAELVANGTTRAVMLDANIRYAEEDLAHRLALRPRLEKDHELRRSLHAERANVTAELARLEIELLTRTQKAERERLEHELRTEQDAQEERQDQRSDTITAADAEPRRPQITDLEKQRTELQQSAATVFAREESLRQRWITQTVAGFLLWLGYASVVATGSVLAMIMSGVKSFEFRPLLSGMRAVASSVFPDWPQWIRLLVILTIVLGLFRLLIEVFLYCDNLLRERWKWHEEKSRADATAQMAPQALTTRTYSRFIALLPFAFAVAVVFSLGASVPEVSGAGDAARRPEAALLTSIFPTIGYSFIGIAISFLATAVFVMYFVRIIHPRSLGEPAFRQSWEFTVPPLLLLLAIALMPLQDGIALTRWIPWAAFMLASSMALACGLVFHGIFKDARRAHDRIARLDRRIRRLSGLATEEEEDDTAIAARQPLEQKRRRLESWFRKLFQRPKPEPVALSQPAAASTGVVPVADAAPAIVTAYRPIDLLVGSDLIPKIEERRAARARLDADLQTADAGIAALESFLSFAAIDDVSRQLHLLKGMRAAVASQQEERRHHANIARQLLALKITSAELAAKSIDPLVANVRDTLVAASAQQRGA